MTGLPVTINHGTVTGKLISAVQLPSSDADIDAVPLAGSVTFTPSVPKVIHAASSSVIVPRAVTVTLDGTGAFTTKLIATNDPDVNPTGWTYLVSFQLTGATLDGFSISVPADTTIDLSTVVPVPDANGTFYLVGPQGPAGAGSAATPPVFAGRYYVAGDVQNLAGAKSVTTEEMCYPVLVSKTCTIDRLALRVDGVPGTTGTVRFGIHAARTDGLPGAVLLDSGASGTIAAAGLVELTVSYTLTAGTLYWVGHTASVAGYTAYGSTGAPFQWELGRAAASVDSPASSVYYATGGISDRTAQTPTFTANLYARSLYRIGSV